MKHQLSNFLRMILIVTPLIFTANVSGQKSVDLKSIESRLEEVSDVLYNFTVETSDKVTNCLTNPKNGILTSKNQDDINSTVNNVKDWSEIQLNELMNVAQDAKAWLSKQYFSSVKQKYSGNSQKPDEVKKDQPKQNSNNQ